MMTCCRPNDCLSPNKPWVEWKVGCGHKSVCLLVAVYLIFATSGHAFSQDSSQCGQPPRVDDEKIQGTIEGKAKLLASWIGDAGLSGHIQAERVDVFRQVPDGMKGRADAYLQYQVCIFLMTDKKLSTKEKIDELIRVRRSFLVPVETSRP